MNIEVVREPMSRIQFQHPVECGENFVCAWVRLTFRRPLIPRAQIHHRFGEKCADIEIVRIFLPTCAHGVGVGLIERRAILRRRVGITVTQRLDQIALHR
jgi:hypothetical protein